MNTIANKKDITSKIMKVDAKLAQKYLNRNTINRPINTHRVKAYMLQMQKGQWHLNGESIIISKNGDLLDGQHRLLAIINGDIVIELLFVFGVAEESFDTINTGDSRTSADVLGITGFTKTVARPLASTIRMDMCMELTGTLSGSADITRALTPQVVRKREEEDSRYLSAVKYILEHKTKSMVLSVSSFAFLLYRFRIISQDREQSDNWILGLMTGADLKETDPRLWIKNKIWREFSKQATTTQRVRCGYVAKAWNFMRTGKVLKHEPSLYRDPLDSMKFLAMETDLKSRKKK